MSIDDRAREIQLEAIAEAESLLHAADAREVFVGHFLLARAIALLEKIAENQEPLP